MSVLSTIKYNGTTIVDQYSKPLQAVGVKYE